MVALGRTPDLSPSTPSPGIHQDSLIYGRTVDYTPAPLIPPRTVDYTPYYAPTIQGVPLSTNYTDAINTAHNAITYADNTIHQTINNTYVSADSTATDAIHQATDNLGRSIQNINVTLDGVTRTVQDNITGSVNRAIDTIDATQARNYNAVMGRVEDISRQIQGINDVVGRQIEVDTSPIASVIADYGNIVSRQIQEEQNRTSDLTNAFIDAQGRQLEQDRSNLSDVLDVVQSSITDAIGRVSQDIENLIPHQSGQDSNPFDFVHVAAITILKAILKVLGIPIDVDNQTIAQILDQKSGWIKETLQKAPANFSDKFSKLGQGDYASIDDFMADFSGTEGNSQLVHFVLVILLGLGAASKVSEIVGGPYFQRLSQLALMKTPTTLPGVQDNIKFLHWFEDYAQEFVTNMKKLGYSEKMIANFEASSHQKLPPFEYLHNAFMFDKDQNVMRNNIKIQGYTDEDIDIMLENYQGGFPPIQDLIRFMVRETFSPEAEKYGLFEEFPKEIMQYWSAQPIGDIWAKHYWGAHWNLPSPQQVFTMFHRGIANEDEVKQYLKLADYSKYWRDNLIKIAYNPVTRVDIRRLYNMGIFDKAKVYRAYLDDGYSPENAQALTEFTIHSEDESDTTTHKHIRKIAQGLVQKAFDRELIDKEEAFSRLVATGMKQEEARITAESWQFDRDTDRDYRKATSDKEKIISNLRTDYEKRVITREYALSVYMALGHTPADAEQELKFSDLRAELKLKEAKIDNIRTLYVKGRIKYDEASARLANIGTKGNDSAYLLDMWNNEKEKKDRQLTETDVNKLFKAGLITSNEYYEYMSSIGFDDREINWLGMLNAPSQGVAQ